MTTGEAEAETPPAPRAELLDRVGDGVLSLDDEGRITYLNRAARRRLDRPESDLRDAVIWEAFPGTADSRLREIVREVRETGTPATLTEYRGPFDMLCEIDVVPSERGVTIVVDGAPRGEILDGLPVGVFRTTPDGEFVDVNDAAASLFGVASKDELLDHRPEEFYADAEDRREFASTLEAEGVVENYEVRLRTLDGEERWVSTTATRREGAGDRTYYDGTIVDVTERRRLQEQRQLLSQLTENAADALWVFSANWEELLFVNSAYEEIWGQSVSTLREHPSAFFEAVHPDDRERVREAMARISDGDPADIEFRANAEEDYGRWVWARGHPVYDDGELQRVIGFSRDITERKRDEQAVERSRKRYRTLLDAAPDAIVAAEADSGRIVEANGAAEELFGRPREELLGLDQSALHPADERDRYRELFRRHLAGKSSAIARFDDGSWVYVTDADGERTPVEINAHVVELGDRSLSYGVFRDVTDRKHREEQLAEYRRQLEETVDDLERSIEELEQFAYVASHDLQEPLRMISSYLELLQAEYAEELDEEADEYIDFAVDGARRMKTLINDLLAFSRVETRDQEFERVSLADRLTEARDNLELQIEETDATITADSLPTVEADGNQMTQLFQNLLSNAIDYSGDDPPRIHVSVETRDDAYAVAVVDEGVGVPPDQHERVFEVFTRGERRDDDDGTGIGLAICKRIVEGHGGTIWVESEPGEGATFRFTIPREGDAE
jgi:PAS domain S-box-containing protein